MKGIHTHIHTKTVKCVYIYIIFCCCVFEDIYKEEFIIDSKNTVIYILH